jgi:DNA-binding IclR family transcriptional regulator
MRRSTAPVVRIQVLARAFAMLENLSASREGAYLTELAAAVDVPLSTAHNILTTLMALGYVEQDQASTRYFCGPKVIQLRNRFWDTSSFYPSAQREVVNLTAATGETCHLSQLVGRQIVILFTQEASNRLVVRSNTGKAAMSATFHASATGKAYLSTMSDEEIAQLLAAEPLGCFTASTITSLRDLHTEIQSVRERGYAANLGEEHPDVYGVAAPIRGAGERKMALTVEIAAPRASQENLQRIAQRLMSTVRRIEAVTLGTWSREVSELRVDGVEARE